MKKRLRELDKSGAALARALGIPSERVYEMWVGKRRIQQEEIGPMARFLEWSENELVARIENRVLNENNKQFTRNVAQQGAPALQPAGDTTLPPLVLYRTAITTTGRQGGVMLFAEQVGRVPRPLFLEFSKKAFALRVLDDSMKPAYKRWDTIMVDPDSPVIEGEDCLFTGSPEAQGGSLSVIACLISSTATHWTVHQYGTKQDQDMLRADFPNAWPIVGRYNRRG